LLDKAITSSSSSRLQALVARFEKAIQAHDARLLAGSTAALAAFSVISITVYSTSDTLARNEQALRHEHTAELPLYGTACEAPALCHDHAAPLAAPSERTLPEDAPFYPETLARNAPALRHEHMVALPHYIGTDRVSTQMRGRPRKKALPP
jgi:hypothetical protein